MSGSEDDKITEKHIAEYQAIQQWRNNVVNSDFIMTSICLPLSILIFSSHFLIEYPPEASCGLRAFLSAVFWLASIGILIMWRFYARHIDKSVRAVYPRICELEEQLSFSFTRQQFIWATLRIYVTFDI